MRPSSLVPSQASVDNLVGFAISGDAGSRFHPSCRNNSLFYHDYNFKTSFGYCPNAVLIPAHVDAARHSRGVAKIGPLENAGDSLSPVRYVFSGNVPGPWFISNNPGLKSRVLLGSGDRMTGGASRKPRPVGGELHNCSVLIGVRNENQGDARRRSRGFQERASCDH